MRRKLELLKKRLRRRDSGLKRKSELPKSRRRKPG